MRFCGKLFIFVIELITALLILCNGQSPDPTTSPSLTARLVGSRNIDFSECGVPAYRYEALLDSRSTLKILGGAKSSAGRWPWMVYLYGIQRRRLVCGATMLNDRWVVTAASCLSQGTNATNYGLIFSRFASSSEVQELRMRVERVLVHPGYVPSIYRNDVALLQLPRPLTFTRWVRPACLVDYGVDIDNSSDPQSLIGAECIVLGWGLTRPYSFRSFPFGLRELSVPIVSDAACQNASFGYIVPGQSRFCAGGQPNKGTCDGDGGGPLLCLHSDRKYYLHGMVSSGLGCGVRNRPDFYTDLGHPEINAWLIGVLNIP